MGEHFVVVFLFFFDMEFFVLEIRNRTTHGPIIQNQLVLRVSCYWSLSRAWALLPPTRFTPKYATLQPTCSVKKLQCWMLLNCSGRVTWIDGTNHRKSDGSCPSENKSQASRRCRAIVPALSDGVSATRDRITIHNQLPPWWRSISDGHRQHAPTHRAGVVMTATSRAPRRLRNLARGLPPAPTPIRTAYTTASSPQWVPRDLISLRASSSSLRRRNYPASPRRRALLSAPEEVKLELGRWFRRRDLVTGEFSCIQSGKTNKQNYAIKYYR
jgi:hypothetical protein